MEIHTTRMLLLAEYLELNHIRLGPVFDFASYVYAPSGKMPEPGAYDCGSKACAIGLTPHLFPDLVQYSISEGRVQSGLLRMLDTDSEGNTVCRMGEFWEVAMHLFGMRADHAEHLFSPHLDAGEIHAHLKSLYDYDDITPSDVAGNIRTFVHLVQTGQLPEYTEKLP